MTDLERNQLGFINLRFGTFIHFNSASVQFHASSEIEDWEFMHENGNDPRRSCGRITKKRFPVSDSGKFFLMN